MSLVEVNNGNFEFPQFKRDSDRIKHYTKLYKNLSVKEAFAKHYQLDNLIDTPEEYIISETKIGSSVKVRFSSTEKGNVSVVSNSPKDLFATKHNVWSWNGLDTDQWFDGEVVDKGNGVYYVDVLEPIKRKFINQAKKTIKNYFQSQIVVVRDLQLQRGGYTGTINVDAATSITGKPYTINAFIPGSMIALNIEKDFKQWIGKDVIAMIVNFADNNGTLSAVCSRKKLLNCSGQSSLINLYDMVFSEGGEHNQVFDGIVTGVINSAKKKGVFVEIPEYSMTGLVQMPAPELVNYRIGDSLQCIIKGVDWPENKEPYKRNQDGIIYECNLKPVLEIVGL